MTIFDKVLINAHKGFEKLKLLASIFSERIKAELNIIRIRIKMNDVQERIEHLYRLIGKRYFDMRSQLAPGEREQPFLNDEEIAAAMAEIIERKKELGDLEADMKREREFFTQEIKSPEDTIV
jgi:uncharacterized protein (DUF849 family)